MSDVKRYDCTNGGARFCDGCYQMTESGYGDYVEATDYDALLAERDQLRAELAAIRGQEPVAFAVFADNGNIRIWSANSTAIRAELIEQGAAITDLYALPPQQTDAVSVPRELLVDLLCGLRITRDRAMKEILELFLSTRQAEPLAVAVQDAQAQAAEDDALRAKP